jgi:multiple sugar transport system permease protein
MRRARRTASSAVPERMRFTRSEHAAGWMFVLPAALLVIAFGLLPIGWSLLLSFQSSDFVSPAKWVGLANYRALESDPEFRSAITRTLVYTALFVPISVLGGLAVAVVLNAKVRFISIYRTAVFIPVACSTVATAIIFNWLLEPTFGVVNYVLGWVGLGPYGFFQNPDQALGSVVLMTSWGWIGFNAIIYLAALQSIPPEIVEAAAIDGAGRFTIFRRVVWPLLGPATLFLVVWSSINSLQVFDEIYVSTRGGPLHATTVVVYYLFQQAFQFFAAGYGAAIAYVLFVAILLLTLLQLWVAKRRVHYMS